eukprot:403341696
MESGENYRLKLNFSDQQHVQGVQKYLADSKGKIQDYLDSLQNPASNKIDQSSQYKKHATLGVNPEYDIQSKQTLESLISNEQNIKNEINAMALDLNIVKRQICQKMFVNGLVYANQSQMKSFIQKKQQNDVYTLMKVKEALLSPYEDGYAAEMNQMFQIGAGRDSNNLQTQKTSAEQERLSIKELLNQKNQPVFSQGHTLNKQANMLNGKSKIEQNYIKGRFLTRWTRSNKILMKSHESLLGYSKQYKQQNVKKAGSAQTLDQAHNQKNKIGQFEISQNQGTFSFQGAQLKHICNDIAAQDKKYRILCQKAQCAAEMSLQLQKTSSPYNIKTLEQMQTYKAEISKLKSKNETLIKEKSQTMKYLELIDEQISICQLFIHKIKLQAKTQ